MAAVTRVSNEDRLDESLREDGSEGDSFRGRPRELRQRPCGMRRQQDEDGNSKRAEDCTPFTVLVIRYSYVYRANHDSQI